MITEQRDWLSHVTGLNQYVVKKGLDPFTLLEKRSYKFVTYDGKKNESFPPGSCVRTLIRKEGKDFIVLQ